MCPVHAQLMQWGYFTVILNISNELEKTFSCLKITLDSNNLPLYTSFEYRLQLLLMFSEEIWWILLAHFLLTTKEKKQFYLTLEYFSIITYTKKKISSNNRKWSGNSARGTMSWNRRKQRNINRMCFWIISNIPCLRETNKKVLDTFCRNWNSKLKQKNELENVVNTYA